jgi:glutamate:GABA antiporter
MPVLGILIVLPTSAITNFSGFISAIQTVFTVYGGHVAAGGAATLSGAGLVLGDACALLFIVCLLTSGATWIMGSDRALAVSCYDGAGPRTLSVINARFGTPVRVNVFSGHPDTPRPFKMPAYRPLTIVLMILVAIASVQLIAPGLGKDWFGADFRPEGWAYAERFTYLWTELLPALCFIVIGVFFWWRGRRTREWAARLAGDAESPIR